MSKLIEDLTQVLQKQRRKIITQGELQKLINISLWDNAPINKIYKLTYQLKNRGILYPIRKELFYIATHDFPIKDEEIEEKRYRKILKDHCNTSCKQRYIWWLTALEIQLYWAGTTLPEIITIVNKDKQALETVMFEKKVSFKKYEIKNKNLISYLLKQTNEVNLPNANRMLIANLELSILESLYNFDTSNWWYIEECIKKAIKKNWKTLNLTAIETIIKQWKHNTSLNRLYNIAKLTYPKLADEIKNLIKKYWFVL